MNYNYNYNNNNNNTNTNINKMNNLKIDEIIDRISVLHSNTNNMYDYIKSLDNSIESLDNLIESINIKNDEIISSLNYLTNKIITIEQNISNQNSMILSIKNNNNYNNYNTNKYYNRSISPISSPKYNERKSYSRNSPLNNLYMTKSTDSNSENINNTYTNLQPAKAPTQNLSIKLPIISDINNDNNKKFKRFRRKSSFE